MKLFYFQLRLNNGELMDFNKECNEVDYSDEKVCVFTNTINDPKPKRSQTLAIVPYNQISVIERITEEV